MKVKVILDIILNYKKKTIHLYLLKLLSDLLKKCLNHITFI